MITKNKLVEIISKETCMSKIEAENFTFHFFKHIRDALINGEKIIIPKLGTFYGKEIRVRKQKKAGFRKAYFTVSKIYFKPFPSLRSP
ncbi:MAG: HU family DNA-binding protein [Candidatus Aminicenantia bacterium]